MKAMQAEATTEYKPIRERIERQSEKFNDVSIKRYKEFSDIDDCNNCNIDITNFFDEFITLLEDLFNKNEMYKMSILEIIIIFYYT